ncbi:CD1375 family protein [Vallitalea guaymasensis]|nr:CD1375 family protein [Vallitalea guaymasensis]
MTYIYMIKVYAYLVKAERRTLESLPEEYQTPVAEKLASEIENK